MPFFLGVWVLILFEFCMFVEAFLMNRGADFIASQFVPFDLILYRLRKNGSFLTYKCQHGKEYCPCLDSSSLFSCFAEENDTFVGENSHFDYFCHDLHHKIKFYSKIRPLI